MLSLNQAQEIKESIIAYYKATFNFQDKEVEKAFNKLLNDPIDGIFKGPYVSLKLPFVKAEAAEQAAIPLSIKPNWTPYDHQVKSWHRLSTANQTPKATIVTTGTGSGKTESFMYPVLDYCYRNLSRPGIKVIILYPMNALATDQAKRFAQTIFEDQRLKGKVRAGLFIGLGDNAIDYPKSMGENNIIENRETILSSPPDILLTNFKMLDYGLLRSQFHDLWTHNFDDNSLLQFLILDELHTYDGAQGTDVANLIRRLKLKLSIPKNQLCPIGTSATIGSGENAPKLLSDYASKIFGETITPDCIITENRVGVAAFFNNNEDLDPFLPRRSALANTKPQTNEGYENYIDRQINIWQSDKENLAQDLLKYNILKDLVAVVNQGKGIADISSITRKLSDINTAFKDIPQWDDTHNFNPKEALLFSLLSLVNEAKITDAESGRQSPLLYTQTQIWIRELSGILRLMDEKPIFDWKENIQANAKNLALPPWFCRECGASGWLGVKQENKECIRKEINDVYKKYFSNDKTIYLLNTTAKFSQKDAHETGYIPSDSFRKDIGKHNLEFYEKATEDTSDITAFRKLDEKGYNEHICPECTTKNTLSIIGTRVSTLSSIAISQTLSTDLEKQGLQARKALAFTNSVQDAAHQAGFIEARNYRFTFRTSLQKVINEISNEISLKDLAQQFMDYWKNNASEIDNQSLNAYYYRFYPSDYMGKSSPEDYMENGQYSPRFQKEFDNRIIWEIFSEFGYNAQIGRTLEKTNASASLFKAADIAAVWENIKDWIAVNDTSNSIKEETFSLFLSLLLHRIRTRGAISHEYLSKFRENDLKLWDLNWNKDSRHFLNRRFGRKTRLPKLVINTQDNRRVADTTFAKRANWYHAYFTKNFNLAATNPDLINEFYDKLFEVLEKCQVVDSKQTQNGVVNYALRAEKIYVSNQLENYECDQCSNSLYVAKNNINLSNAKCLKYRCQGHYVQLQNIDKSNTYYQQVYNRNKSPRIYAADHTGLLERNKRENVEIDFKTRPNFNSLNALVATSTLEMGIDIGDLNIAMNNSVPPMPSNFLQRIGRAGRKSGSALIINFVKNQAHDLFYFREPTDMMAGEVNTPGCFLEAKEILKRHFFAFCIDTWTATNYKENVIPFFIRDLKIEDVNLEDTTFFMNQILGFIKSNEEQLFTTFKTQYDESLKTVFEGLHNYLLSDSFYQNHNKIFRNLKNEIADITQKQQDIDNRIKELGLGENDNEKILLKDEKKNLGQIIRSIKNRSTLEHLTNVGALPNYAFPETGVTLQAVVMGNKVEESKKLPQVKDFEIVRPAGQALKELAPDNYFYSQGFKFLVSGINTIDWSDKANFHKKRFCSNCDHLEIEEIAPKGFCPKCNDESWNASANVHHYAKMISLKSFNNQASATINDKSDERDVLIYHQLSHFNFKEKTHGAYALPKIPFGIEFVKEVSITQSNLGRGDKESSNKIKVNQKEVAKSGFVCCRYCGKSSSFYSKKDYKFHYGYCKHKDSVYEGKSNNIFEEVYLFKEMQTEVLKVLLPVQELNTESEIKMFKAGIELGLKKYFKGNPQHIRLYDYKEFNKTSNQFDRYLLMCDTIPGGTAYLEKLFDTKEFSKLLKIAYQQIKTCKCQYEGKDGCYRCIFSYSNQYHQLELRREVAEKRFEQILENTDAWEFFPNGLGNITNKGNIEESELERRFVRSFRKLSKKQKEWSIEAINDEGTVEYNLQFKNEEKEFSYRIRPQVSLGTNDGVALYTRPDFVFICTSFSIKGQAVENINELPRIAIYLDGYQFHASEENNHFTKDVKKREAIIQAPNYYVWTLSWDDVRLFDLSLEDVEKDAAPKDYDAMTIRLNGSFSKTKHTLLGAAKKPPTIYNGYNNSFSRLIEVAKNLNDTTKLKSDLATYLSFFHTNLFNPSFAPTALEQAFLGVELDQYCKNNKTLDGLIPVNPIENNELFTSKVIVNPQQKQVYHTVNLLATNTIDKTQWNNFWILSNLLQFFEAYESKEISTLEIEPSFDITEILSVFDEQYHQIINKLHSKGIIKSLEDEVNLYSLLDNKGEIIAEADLIVHSIKKFINPSSKSDKDILKKNGYTEITIEQINSLEI